MKNLKTIIGVLFLTVIAFQFSSCSENEDIKDNCYFTLGISSYSYSGSGDFQTELNEYLSAVSKAYYSALGMTDGKNVIYLSGDYNKVKEQMKAKFESASLPQEPASLSGIKYSFTYTLSGCDLNVSSDQNVDIVSKTFTNK